jgi:hypothetical protein
MAVVGWQWCRVISLAAVKGSGQPTDCRQRSQVTVMAPSSVGVV